MIEINNLTTTVIEEETLKKIAEKVLEGENPPPKFGGGENDLSIALVGQGRIRALNKKYRKKNRVTDVLAFSGNGLGELVICLREVKKNAKRFKSTFEKELAKVLIHGALHLLGYDHEKNEEKTKLMEVKEQHYLLEIFPEK